jgi:hypothetical protein
VAAEVDAMLAQMAAEGQAAGAKPTADGQDWERGRVGVRPPKVRYTHEAMADLIIEHPMISQNQLAAYFGYTPGWISTIINSDAFQSFLAARKEELVDPELRLTLNERFRALATQSLRVLQAKVSKPEDQVDAAVALKALELSGKALGIGGNAPTQVLVASEDRIANLAHRLIALKRTQPAGPAQDENIVDVAFREAGRGGTVG